MDGRAVAVQRACTQDPSTVPTPHVPWGVLQVVGLKDGVSLRRRRAVLPATVKLAVKHLGLEDPVQCEVGVAYFVNSGLVQEVS
jgi:hypothetical protein